MKKTITANLSGMVFHIEEDAYEKLNRYLSRIRENFRGAEESAEIINDIEARIAELFHERMDGSRQVVTDADVDQVIAIMGEPDDYIDSEAEDFGARSASPGTSTAGRKRLFRHPDDKWVGGVLGGIAAYFGIDALILRIIYIIFLFMGFGILLYVILWIVVPQAETAADRLMMRGEPVTVENISRMFHDGAETVKTSAEQMAAKAQAWTGDVRSTGKASKGVNEFFNFLGDVVRFIAIAFVKLLGVILLLIGAALAVAFLAAIIGQVPMHLSEIDVNFADLGRIFFSSSTQATFAYLGITAFLAVPILALLYAGARLLFNLKTGGKWIAAILGPLWFVSLVILAIVGVQIANDFRHEADLRTDLPIEQPVGETMYVDVLQANDQRGNLYKGHRGHYDLLEISDGKAHIGLPFLEVERSLTDEFELVLRTEAHGRTYKDAALRAEAITGSWEQQDSIIRIGRSYTFNVADKYRGQHMRYILKVPMGRAVNFGPDTEYILHDVPNVTNTYDRDMVGLTWTMTPNGLSSSVAPEDVPNDLRSRAPQDPDEGEERIPDPVVQQVNPAHKEGLQLPNLFTAVLQLH